MMLIALTLIFCMTYSLVFAFDYVNKNVVNMHAQPDDLSEVISQAIYATPIECLEERGSWCCIQTPDLYRGWVEKNAVISREQLYLEGQRCAQVHSLFGHLFRVNDTTPHAPLVTLPFGAKVEVVTGYNNEQRWVQVRLLDGQIAWMQRGDLQVDPQPITLKEMMALSQRFLGLPYTWGGVSTFGFDCSGYVQMLYGQMGILLPRDSYLQAEAKGGVAIELKNLEEGDLLFFGPNQKKINHVGIYLADNKFIHAKAKITRGSPTVQISDLLSPNYDETLVCVRRFLKDEGGKDEG